MKFYRGFVFSIHLMHVMSAAIPILFSCFRCQQYSYCSYSTLRVFCLCLCLGEARLTAYCSRSSLSVFYPFLAKVPLPVQPSRSQEIFRCQYLRSAIRSPPLPSQTRLPFYFQESLCVSATIPVLRSTFPKFGESLPTYVSQHTRTSAGKIVTWHSNR